MTKTINATQVAKMLGYTNGHSILHLPLKRLVIQTKTGRNAYRFDLAEVEAYKRKHTV